MGEFLALLGVFLFGAFIGYKVKESKDKPVNRPPTTPGPGPHNPDREELPGDTTRPGDVPRDIP